MAALDRVLIARNQAASQARETRRSRSDESSTKIAAGRGGEVGSRSLVVPNAVRGAETERPAGKD
ncbi:hypothetical protein B1812_14500 [Methylocystis bryophila]|uniref:Uncharacterized protein n=1 Tax=Methylocystis bryophila TaxID=655015 RepID=A0A1W6MX16_9HYPH|nr:hypothetical protein B1812_14500 [Methylocystis bryophila]